MRIPIFEESLSGISPGIALAVDFARRVPCDPERTMRVGTMHARAYEPLLEIRLCRTVSPDFALA